MGLLIACLLFAVYLALYSGRIHSGDELAILSVTHNLLFHGTLDTNINLWGRYGQPYPGGMPDHFGLEGDLFTKKGIAQSLVMLPLYALGCLVPAWGCTHISLLTHSIVTAFTGAVIYLLGRRMGYERAAAVMAALAFGLATPSMVYARYIFGEPLIGLALALIFYGFPISGDGRGKSSRGNPFGFLLIGFGVALAMTTNLVNSLLAPMAVIWIGAAHRLRLRTRDWAMLLTPMALAVGLIGMLNLIRFGSPFEAGQNPELGEGFTTPLWIGLYGLLFSPARGFVFFCPVVLIGVAGWPLLRRRSPWIAWAIVAVSTLYLVVYGTYFAWWGGYNWGPRYIVALGVPAAIASLPVFEMLWKRPNRVTIGVLVLLLLVSVGIQLLGTAVPFGRYEVELAHRFGFDYEPPINYQFGDAVMNDPALSPIVGHAGMLADEGPSDLAWVTPDGLDPAALLPILAVIALLAAVISSELRMELPLRTIAMPIVILVAVTIWAMWRNSLHPLDEFHIPHPALDAIANDVRDENGVLLLVPEFTRTVLNNYPGFPPSWGMPPKASPDETLERVLQTALRRHDRLSIVSWFPPLDPAAWIETRLAEEHYAYTPRWAFGSFWVGRYVIRRFDETWRPAGWESDAVGIRLTSTAVTPESPEPGDELYISLEWEVTSDLNYDYVTYVHLLDASGLLHTQADHVPQNGFRPTITWRRGDEITDRFVLAVPETLPPGEYMIRVGMYDWRSPEVRLSGQVPDGGETDGFTILSFRVR